MHYELINILQKLDINIHIAPDESDPIIIQIPQKHNAYVPLDTLEVGTFQGEYHHIKDVFQKMIQQYVALWATTITYNFIELDVIQVIHHLRLSN